jgi:hypothetical protein
MQGMFILGNPTSLLCSLQRSIVKSGRTLTDGFKIIVYLGKKYNNRIKMLNYKTEMLNHTCMYKH